jgi:hypothetical protein
VVTWVDALAAPSAVAAAILVVAGAAKLKKPLPVTGSLALLKLPRSTALVRGLGSLEIAIGIAALSAEPRVTYTILAGVYAAFAVFTAWALKLDKPLASCGCFGDPDTPAAPSHVLLTALAAVTAAAAAASGTPTLRALLVTEGWRVLPLAIYLGVGVYLAFLAFTALPRAVMPVQEGRTKTTWFDGSTT